ncbi:putative glucuronosyltransferase [Dichanthelium oligosanthes]|uniref:Glycosyltransferases n=1 Tax=Dichanthelium oligosanthes TaxID=888268 RepID=A0A1E5VGP5_9POAL|nr:putative glucuronosyltransferase [Dichanthelium oligosanthes]
MASPKHPKQHARLPPPKQKQKQRPLLLRRAMLHSCLCFLLGLLTGLAPSDWADAHLFRDAVVRAINDTAAQLRHYHYNYYQQQQQQPLPLPQLQIPLQQPQLLVVVTTTGMSERERRAAGLTRTAHALRLVSPPVVWLVVEAARAAPATARLLRRTGVPYRHLTYTDNFTTTTSSEEERHHQRNVALGHIEQHRLRGVVLFAGLAEVYDLRLLEQLRQIRTLGAWPVATVWEQDKKVAVEGPVCSSTSTGAASAWFSSSSSAGAGLTITTSRPTPPLTSDDSSVHGFAFASDLLWDPARWDRFPTSEPDQSQDSIKFVQRLVVEDYNKTMAIPDYTNCSQVMVWRADTTLLL